MKIMVTGPNKNVIIVGNVKININKKLEVVEKRVWEKFVSRASSFIADSQ